MKMKSPQREHQIDVTSKRHRSDDAPEIAGKESVPTAAATDEFFQRIEYKGDPVRSPCAWETLAVGTRVVYNLYETSDDGCPRISELRRGKIAALGSDSARWMEIMPDCNVDDILHVYSTCAGVDSPATTDPNPIAFDSTLARNRYDLSKGGLLTWTWDDFLSVSVLDAAEGEVEVPLKGRLRSGRADQAAASGKCGTSMEGQTEKPAMAPAPVATPGAVRTRVRHSGIGHILKRIKHDTDSVVEARKQKANASSLRNDL